MHRRAIARAHRPAGDAAPQPPNTMLDRYTVGHAATGVLLGLNNFSLPVAAGVLIAFQVVPELSRMLPGSFAHPRPDTVSNAAVDFTAGMLAWWLMSTLPGATDR